jgi:hypothetical protein
MTRVWGALRQLSRRNPCERFREDDYDAREPCVLDPIPCLDLGRVICHAPRHRQRQFDFRLPRRANGLQSSPHLEREFINVDQILRQYCIPNTIPKL